jgi:hypothetical protein
MGDRGWGILQEPGEDGVGLKARWFDLSAINRAVEEGEECSEKLVKPVTVEEAEVTGGAW